MYLAHCTMLADCYLEHVIRSAAAPQYQGETQTLPDDVRNGEWGAVLCWLRA